MDRISGLVDEINKKSKERDELLEKLVRSLSLKQLWGSDPIQWPVYSGIYGSQREGFYFYIKDSAEVKKKYSLEEIPEPMKKAKHIADALKHISRFRKVK